MFRRDPSFCARGGIGVFREYKILTNNWKTIGILLIQTK